ncbi:S-adenosyl-L-methionine-dependent methyltransferase [Xylaria bambusicola]|uniref:S-adenosyl-L-methionine-dependent methyltransferase n=1 Tax=Xylaria bambusicola TaxID=326684 RepID=UPI002007D58E|nr:S-adenosyl-L-methionine-dependent methyltransferase [Xylaria bambusicola]KAI0509539.1 S-adenosyl-L-methionine-dependent methyltransferase [Xylaria bambusicola]
MESIGETEVCNVLRTDGGVLKDLIGSFINVEPSALKPDSSLEELGLDSIAAVQLANALLLQVQLQVHPDELFKASLNTLAGHAQQFHRASTKAQSAGRNNSRSATDVTVEAAAAAQERLVTRPSLDLSYDPLEILAQSNSIYEAASRRSGFADYWSTVSPLQQDLLLSYINEAFITLGVNLSEHPQGVEMPIIPHIPKHERLVKRLFDVLETRYIVRQCRGKVLRGSDCIDVYTSAHLCEQLRVQHPSFECEAKLLNLIGPRLAECLSGKVDPLSVLFGSTESRQVMDNFYRNAPMMAAHTEQLVSFFLSLIEAMATTFQTPIRVLEIGAGTGGTTSPLVAALANIKFQVNYTFTDIGASFVHKAKARWEETEWMNFAVLDIEAELPEYFRGQFDIVVGTNVVHATRNRTATCRRLRDALRPGGILALSELTRPIDWYDICFGLLDGWWLADEGYAIQPATVWMDAFEKAGFKAMGHSSGNSDEANTQQLLIACTKD